MANNQDITKNYTREKWESTKEDSQKSHNSANGHNRNLSRNIFTNINMYYMDNNDKHTVKENVMNVRLQQDQA